MFGFMCYAVCTRCGAYHDDGTAEYCMDCLDELYDLESTNDSDIECNEGETFNECINSL